jgi:uncharacterized spore protein YtfJ
VDVKETISSAAQAMSVNRVFGEPYQRNGITIIPVARLAGGAGGGGGEAPQGEGQGEGSGFGVSAKPAGVFVVDADTVRWRPAVDVNRVILGAQVVAVVALLTARSIIRSRQRWEHRAWHHRAHRRATQHSTTR